MASLNYIVDAKTEPGEIEVYEPFPMFYGVESGNLEWFGRIDCLLEGD